MITQRLKFFVCTKLSPACKFAGGIRELQAAPSMSAIYRRENLHLNLKIETTFKNLFTIRGIYTKAYPTIPLCRWFRFAQLAKGKKFRP
jgi:hypothetical protein